MKKIIKISMLIAIVLLASCSKEKKLERSFYTKDGRWEITSLSINSYKNGVIDDVIYNTNAGEFNFEKYGRGSCLIRISASDPAQYSSLTWSTSSVIIDSEIYLVQSMGKSTMSLETSSLYSIGADSYRDDIIMYLEKDK